MASVDKQDHLAPVTDDQRHWTILSFVTLWGAAICTPSSFIFGASMLVLGNSFASIIFIMLTSSLIVLPLVTFNAVPGTRYGISFPVYCRASFGHKGAIVAALSRGLVAIGWLSFNLWIGAQGLFQGVVRVAPSLKNCPILMENLNLGEFLFFFGFLLVHLAAILLAPAEKLRVILWIATPIQIGGLLALFIWSLLIATPSEILDATAQIAANSTAGAEDGGAVLRWFNGLTAAVAGWTTMALNIADLSRFTKHQRTQIVGQAIGFPLLNTAVPLVGVVALGAMQAYKNTHGVTSDSSKDWDLVTIFNQFSPPVHLMAACATSISMMSCNLVANVVSPANDISNLAPRHISFRVGATISLVLAAVMMPWALFSTAKSFVTNFLVGYSMVTGALLGVMLTDYFLVRRQRLNVEKLYNHPLYHHPDSAHTNTSSHTHTSTHTLHSIHLFPSTNRNDDTPKHHVYHQGCSPAAALAVILAITPCLPGFALSLTPSPTRSSNETGVGGASGDHLAYDFLTWVYSVAVLEALLVSSITYYLAVMHCCRPGRCLVNEDGSCILCNKKPAT